MEAADAQVAMALHLGMPVLEKYEGPGPRPCPQGDSCRTRGEVEVSGRHTLQCAHLTRRHNLVRDVLASLAGPVAQTGSLATEQGLGAQAADAPHGGEENEDEPEEERDLSRPGDVVYRLATQIKRTFVDVTCVGIRVGDNGATRIAQRAEKEKVSNFKRRFQSNGHQEGNGVFFVPFGVSTFGTFGSSACKEVSRLARAYGARGIELLTEAFFGVGECIKQRIATAVVSTNATAIRETRAKVGCRDLSWARMRRGAACGIGSRHSREEKRYREIVEGGTKNPVCCRCGGECRTRLGQSSPSTCRQGRGHGGRRLSTTMRITSAMLKR